MLKLHDTTTCELCGKDYLNKYEHCPECGPAATCEACGLKYPAETEGHQCEED